MTEDDKNASPGKQTASKKTLTISDDPNLLAPAHSTQISTPDSLTSNQAVDR